MNLLKYNPGNKEQRQASGFVQYLVKYEIKFNSTPIIQEP